MRRSILGIRLKVYQGLPGPHRDSYHPKYMKCMKCMARRSRATNQALPLTHMQRTHTSLRRMDTRLLQVHLRTYPPLCLCTHILTSHPMCRCLCTPTQQARMFLCRIHMHRSQCTPIRSPCHLALYLHSMRASTSFSCRISISIRPRCMDQDYHRG